MYKVLIVDDEESIRTGLSVSIDWRLLNCTVIGCAADGSEALELIRQSAPDIILSDISMEPMSGIELCKILTQEFPQIKCILLTGFYDFDHACQAIKYNVVELLLKPTSPSKIKAAVQRAISKIQENTITEILNAEIQQRAIENLSLMQSMLLQNIYSGVEYSDSLPHLLADANINLREFFVITIFVEAAEKEEPQAGFYSRTEQLICKYLPGIFGSAHYYVAFRGDQYIRIAIDIPPNCTSPEHDIHNDCHKLASMIDTLTDFYVTIGISALHDDIYELCRAAQESDNASHFAIYSIDDPVIEYSSLPILSNEIKSEIKTLMDELSDSISRLDFKATDRLLDNLQTFCTLHRIPFLDSYNICLNLLNICFQQFFSYDILGFSSNEQLLYRQKLKNSSSIEAQYVVLRSAVSLISSALESKSTTSSLISSICCYIRSNYRTSLSLDSIAEVFSISPGYLSRIFKKQMNVNLSTYIQQIRIDKAKELILSTDLHTYEIAEAVGIADPVYFSKLFKKLTGLRVRDFKAQNQADL